MLANDNKLGYDEKGRCKQRDRKEVRKPPPKPVKLRYGALK